MNLTEHCLLHFRRSGKHVVIEFNRTKDDQDLLICCDGATYNGTRQTNEEALINSVITFEVAEITKRAVEQ